MNQLNSLTNRYFVKFVIAFQIILNEIKYKNCISIKFWKMEKKIYKILY